MNEFAENVTGTINTSGLQEGLHRLGVRYKNSNGVWGPIYSTLFEIQNTTSPTQTTNVIASAGNKKVTLQWTANTDFDLDYYIIYRSTTSGFTPSTTDSIGFAKSSATTFKDSGLVNNTTYYYKISAVDIAHLISTPSAEVSAMPFYFNKKPVLKLAYNDISVIEDAVAMNLDSIKHHFHDSDGVLTYSLKSLDSTIVIASNVNSELILNFQANAFGITSVVVIATDDSSAVVSDTFKVTINSVNDNTVLKSAFRDTSFNEDFGKVFVCSMTSVFSDPDNSVLTYTNQNLSGGVTTSISNDSLYLISSLNFNGSVNIRVTASDGSTTAMDTFTVNVISVNDAPVAQVDTITVIAGIAKSIAVLLNDNDVEAQTLHIASILQSPLHGTASIDAKDSSIVYTATSTYFGPDSLTYSITDGNGGTASARIRINVLAAPAFKALTLSMALHQNPAISRYADIAIIADTTLQSLPTTMSFFGVDSSAITMTAVSGSSNVFKGGVEFTQSGTYTVKTKATSVTSAQQIISRVFSVTLAKAGFAVKATSLDHMAFLMIAPKTFSGTECFISTQENEKDEIVYHFGPEHSFDQNIELSMSIPENLQEVDPGKLFITQKQNGIWVPIRTQVFPDEKLIKSQVKSLGDFKILFDPNFTGDNTVPKTFALNQNYPNPFNPQTRITFDLPRDGRTTLIVYNTLGQKVKTLTQGFSLAGRYSLSWDGKDERGNMVSSGMYLYRLQTERTAVSKKMLFIK